ncbi:MAG: PIN domain-containing protein [Proteobacteria bacterium]|nr:PIN domain-containing protein [Pseudomonadota bacterium]
MRFNGARNATRQNYQAWRDGQFKLASCERQLEELNRVSRRPFFQNRLKPAEVGRMVNAIRHLAMDCDPLPLVELSPDPDDDWLLAVAQVSRADYLVTGDKSDLLALRHFGVTRILTAREFLDKLT